MADVPQQGMTPSWQFPNAYGVGIQDESVYSNERPGVNAPVNAPELPGYPELLEQIRCVHLGVASHGHRGSGMPLGGVRAVAAVLMRAFPGHPEDWYEDMAARWIVAVE